MNKWTPGATGVDPSTHKTRHQDAGADEISVVGLSGLLADDQHVLDAEVTAVAVAHALATAANDFLVASGSGAYVKKTLAETILILALPLRAVTTAQFDKTNDAALANITGLSVSLVTGKTYIFRAVLFVDANATGGHQYAVSGTATASAIKYQVNSVSNTTNLNVINSRQTALGGAVGQAGATIIFTEIIGVIVCSGTGTLTIQFAQNVATAATTSSVLTQSSLEAQEV